MSHTAKQPATDDWHCYYGGWRKGPRFLFSSRLSKYLSCWSAIRCCSEYGEESTAGKKWWIPGSFLTYVIKRDMISHLMWWTCSALAVSQRLSWWGLGSVKLTRSWPPEVNHVYYPISWKPVSWEDQIYLPIIPGYLSSELSSYLTGSGDQNSQTELLLRYLSLLKEDHEPSPSSACEHSTSSQTAYYVSQTNTHTKHCMQWDESRNVIFGSGKFSASILPNKLVG